MQLQHLKIESSLIIPYALLPGDPKRVDVIGEKLEKFEIVGQNREFRVGVGAYKNVPITVCSTGIGCPSTAMATEVLIGAGARILIRLGTCGGAWRADIPVGSLIIPVASIRDEGTTKEYVPDGFPAVADFGVVQALVEAARKNAQRYYVGINRTHDAFYGNLESITKWGRYLLDSRWQKEDTPILSSEMESSALFVIAALRNVKAGAILAVNADPEPLKERILGKKQQVASESSEIVTEEIVEKMISVALDAMVILSHRPNSL
jgi:uridine phosphorylase